MNTDSIKHIVSVVMAWAAFLMVIAATLKLFKVSFIIQIPGTVTELALVACALALAKMP